MRQRQKTKPYFAPDRLRVLGSIFLFAKPYIRSHNALRTSKLNKRYGHCFTNYLILLLVGALPTWPYSSSWGVLSNRRARFDLHHSSGPGRTHLARLAHPLPISTETSEAALNAPQRKGQGRPDSGLQPFDYFP